MSEKSHFLTVIAAALLLVVLLVAPIYAADGTHVVQSGETLPSIASRYGISVEALQLINGLSNGSQIVVGMVLAIPDTSRYSYSTPQASTSYGGSAYQIGYPVSTATGSQSGAVARMQPGSSYTAGSYRLSQATGGCTNPYIVQSGDTLSVIAARCGVSSWALANVNSLGPSSSIRVGQRLTIPTSAAGGSTSGYYNVQPTPEPRSKGVVCSNPYLVQPGDTLTVIAVRCGVTTANLRQWNGLRSDAIWTGQMLITRGPSYGSNPTPLAVRTPVVVMPYVSGPRATPTPRIEPTISPW